MIYAIQILEKKLYKYVVYFIGLLISYCIALFQIVSFCENILVTEQIFF